MKFEKASYGLFGRFPAGRKYGVFTKMPVDGYKISGCEEIGLHKENGWWYVDHITTGLRITNVGCKTREAAATEYMNHYKESVDKFTGSERYKEAVEKAAAAPYESEVEKWETVKFTTLSDWRMDKVTTAAKNAGLVTKKGDENSYIKGGCIDIAGPAEKIAEIKALIKSLEKPAEEERPATEEKLLPAVIETVESKAAESEPAEAESTTAETAEAESAQDIEKERIKAARAERIAGYDFTGTEITGRGWRIVFDGDRQKTRVIFTKAPAESVREMVKEAGFWWIPSMKSWNRRLNRKSYKAAVELAKKLPA